MTSIKNFKDKLKNNSKKSDLFERKRSLNKDAENLTKSEKLMNGIGIWTSFYRRNPQRFVKDYFIGIQLKLFQQILLYFMMNFNYFMYLAARGQGKTTLVALFCCIRAILFPGTKIIIASGNKSQSAEVLEKILEFKKECPNLAREISELKTQTSDARCEFHNGSWIRIVASNDGARSKRANLIIVDEFRMVDLGIINKVLRKFLTAPRNPRYLNKPEYKHLKERNKEIYLSSAFYKHHWSYNKMKSYFKAMSKGKSYFVCGLPYQLSISEGLLMEEQIIDEMAEDDFDPIGFSMEMECKWFGESEKSYFKFDDLETNRRITYPIYPKSFYKEFEGKIKDKNFKYIPKEEGELRFISCDVSAMGGKQNDASAYTIARLIPSKQNKNKYDRQICYMETIVGGHTFTQALRIRELFEEFECDYIVLDTLGYGLGIYDQICMDIYDKDKGKLYPAFTCMNNKEMADRCLTDDAPAKVFSVKASAEFNSRMAIDLKDDLKRKKLKILISELEGRNILKSFKGYDGLTAEEKVKLEMPYLQITAAINEMVGLSNEGKDGVVKLKESGTNRKDRYSSIGYLNVFARHMERELLQSEDDTDWSDIPIFVSDVKWTL